MKRNTYGFEIKKDFYALAKERLDKAVQREADIEKYGFPRTEVNQVYPTLF